jgi:hypothetical protein
VSVCKLNVASCDCAVIIFSLLATQTFSSALAWSIKDCTCSSVAPLAVFAIFVSLTVALSYSFILSIQFFKTKDIAQKATAPTQAIFLKVSLLFSADFLSQFNSSLIFFNSLLAKSCAFMINSKVLLAIFYD